MKKLTLTLEDQLYEDLHRHVGQGQIGRFIAEAVRPRLARMAAANDTQAVSAFGMLAHRAKPGTEADIHAAQHEYMRKRYANKLSAAGQ
jgi:metal-responsive CopG/Arc/MetJ family transcriptional regulator